MTFTLKITHVKFIYFWKEVDMKIDQDEAPGQETNYTHAGLIVVSL